MGCATGIVKYSLFVFNTLWATLGILVILFAALGWDAMPPNYAIGIIALGSVILIISFFGCFGALRESPRMLWTYASILLVLLILIVLLMVIGTGDVFKKYALKGVDDFWNKEITSPGAMDQMQKTYSCCGRNSAEDYMRIGRIPPASCCKDSNCINPLNLNVIGCLTKVEEAFADEAATTKHYEWGLISIDLIIFVFAIMLAIQYSNRKRRFNY